MTEHASEQREEVSAPEPEAVSGYAPATAGPLSMGPALARAIGNRAMGKLAGRMAIARQNHDVPATQPERVLVLGLYERPLPGGYIVPAQELLMREATSATQMRPVMMGGMEESFNRTWRPLAPSGLASATLVQEAMEGNTYNIKSIYFNTAGVDLLAKYPPGTGAGRMADFPEGTFQTGAELRSVVANLAANQHKVDVYVRHRGGLSIVRATTQTVEGAPLPADWGRHLPPSFRTMAPEGGSTPPPASGGGTPPATPEEAPPSTVRPGAKGAAPAETPATPRPVAPTEAPPSVKLGPSAPAKAPTAPADPAVRNIASQANGRLSSEIDLVVVGTALKGVLIVAQFIGTILMLTDFMNMATNALASRGFMLTAEREQAGEIRDRAIKAQEDYDKQSDEIHFMGFPLMISFADPPSLPGVLDSLSDLGSKISDARIDLRKQSTRVKGALKEVSAKRKAAEAILNSPEASGALGAATFGTAELAKIFGAYVDLDALEGALMSADSAMDRTLDRLDDDFDFVINWYEYLDNIAIAAGVRKPRATVVMALPEPHAPEPDLDTPLPGP